MTESLQFRVSSALKDIIGKDLITDDFVAIFELVKNSFDAFANKVTIHFDLDKENNGKIYIIDDGKGMSKNDLIEKWLFVAFSAKRDQTEDEIQKVYSGYKGIGRFSCDRLGRTLRVFSKINSENKIHRLDVNWDNFERDSKKEFININVDYSEEETFSLPLGLTKEDAGVVLELGSLRDESSWNRNKLIKLRRSLQKLIDPIENKKHIEIKCIRELQKDEVEREKAKKEGREPNVVNGKVVNTIFTIFENKTTKLKAKITPEGYLETELVDRGTFIYKIEEDIKDNYPELIKSEFCTEISFLNRAAKISFRRLMNIRAVEYGSIFLLRNGFRVYPIGEEVDDYWGIARRKQQGYARYLGSRDLLGFVKITGGEEKFRESSSRNQGLIQTKASKELIECVKHCIIKFEAYVVGVTWKDKIDSYKDTSERINLDSNRFLIINLIENLTNSKGIKVLDYNRNLVSILNEKAREFEPSLKKLHTIADNLNDEELIKQVSNAGKALLKAKIAEQEAERIAELERKARSKAEEETENALKEIESISKEKDDILVAYKEEVKRTLFLTGSESRDKELLEGFIHQIILYSSDIKASLQTLLQSPSDIESLSSKEIINIFFELYEANEKIISTSRFATTANFRLKSSLIKEDLNLFVEEYLRKIASAYNEKINIVTRIDKKIFNIKFNPIEMGMILENFISNSKKAKATNIVFISKIKSNILELIIEDDGKGLDKQIIDEQRIFEKGFTRTDGSGLGLYFCKNQIEGIGGELGLTQIQPKRGASFTIRVAK